MDFKKLTTKISNLRYSPNFLYERKDGGIVLRYKEKSKYCLIYIENHGYTKEPTTPYQVDIYSILLNAQFGADYDDFISNDGQTIYQIYGINLPEIFRIDELCKKTRDMKYFESYFRDEIFDSVDGRNLSEELAKLVDMIG